MSFWKTHRTLLVLGLILVVGFAIRAAWISDIDLQYYPRSIPAGPQLGAGGPQDPFLIGYDGVRYHAVATNLLFYGTFGHHPGIPDSWRPPGYPLVLYSIYSVFGPDVLMVRFIQALLGCIQALLVYLITKRLSESRTTALVAAALYAISYDAVLMTAMLYSELWSGLAITASILLLLVVREDSRKIRWLPLVLSCALLGFAALIRPGNALFLVVALLYLWLFTQEQQRARALIVGTLCVFAVILPWVVRNSMLHDRPVSLTSHGGLVFFIAHHPKSQGSFVPEHERYTPEQQQELSKPGLDAADKDRLHYRFALESIRDHPGHAIGLFFKKQWLLWMHLENRNFFLARLGGMPVPLIVFNLLVVAAIVGMVVARMQFQRYFLLYGFILFYGAMISLVFYYHGPRTRVELLPVLSIFAAVGLTAIPKLWQARR